MASRSLGRLTLDLIAKTGGFEKGLDRAARAAEQRMKKIRREFKDFQKQAKTIGKAFLGVAAAGAALGGVVTIAARAGKEIKNMADVANASAAEFQATAYGVKTVGIETDKWSDILKDTNDRIGDFVENGGGPMADFFDNIAPKVGVTAEQFRKLSGPQALQLYVKSLEDANLNQQQMTFYMEAIAGDSAKLLPLLKNNAAALKEQADRARDLGLVLSDMQVESLSQLSDDIDRLGQLFGSFTKQYAAELAPVIKGLVEYLEESIIAAGGFGKVAADAADWTVEAFGNVADVIHGLHVVVKGLELGFQGAALLVTTSWSAVGNTIHSIISGAAEAIDDLIRKANDLPGVDIDLIGEIEKPEFLKVLNDASAALLDKVAETKKELHELAMEPMPSETIKGFAERAKKEIEEAVKAAEEARRTMAGANGGGAGSFNVAEAAKAQAEELDKLIDAASASTREWRKAKDEDSAALDSVTQSLMSEEESILASYERRRDIILANTEETSLASRDLLARLEQQTNDELSEINQGFWANYLDAAETALTSLDDLAASTISNFSSGVGNALESMVFDAESASDAFKGLAEGMARSIINALGEMAAQWLAYQVVQMVVGKTTATASAAAMVAQAQAASAMASLNAFASTAAIPIVGPAAAPAAAAAAGAATAPFVATVAAASFAGMFDEGGVIPSGKWGIAGERGPEIVQGPAHVTSRRDTAKMMGGGDVVVNMYEDASKAGSVNQREQDGKKMIDVFVANIRSDGAAARAMQSTYGLQRRGT